MLLETEDAVRNQSFFDDMKHSLSTGDVQSTLISSPYHNTQTHTLSPSGAMSSSDMSVKGQIECGSQYHFSMETQSCLVVPEEDGYTVHSATQWVTYVQLAVANTLGIPVSR